MTTDRWYRCKFCGFDLPAWYRVAKVPNGTMLLNYLSQHHPDEMWRYRKRMETEDISTVVAEAVEVIEEEP